MVGEHVPGDDVYVPHLLSLVGQWYIKILIVAPPPPPPPSDSPLSEAAACNYCHRSGAQRGRGEEEGYKSSCPAPDVVCYIPPPPEEEANEG